MRRLVDDTLRQVAALDTTRRDAIERTLNGVERLLALQREAAPEVRLTLQALLHGAGSERTALVARLYRELVSLRSLALTASPRPEASRAAHNAAA